MQSIQKIAFLFMMEAKGKKCSSVTERTDIMMDVAYFRETEDQKGRKETIWTCTEPTCCCISQDRLAGLLCCTLIPL
jgi:hypothetical protein